MSTAIFGLIGVLVGTILTATNNFILAARRERTERIERERVRAVEFREAVRIMMWSLCGILSSMRDAISSRTWTGYNYCQRTLEDWSKYRALIARESSQNHWLDIVHAIEIVDGLHILDALGEKCPLGDKQVAAIQKDLETVEKGRQIITTIMVTLE